MKLAGVVTLYHPTEDVYSNIESYLDQLDILYVIDNTENPSPKVKDYFSKNNKIEYIAFRDNKGIAYAMNYALQKASNFDFLLTMDQDSHFIPGMMKKYKNSIERIENEKSHQVGMYAVNFDQRVDPVISRYKYVDVAITSGSIIPIKLAVDIGGFDENLFIDEVDNEFCYRLRQKGYKIMEFPYIVLKHSLGNQTFHKILGMNYNTFNHNALRKYYRSRNRVYVLKKYPNVRFFYIKNIIKDIIKVILAESDKKNKLYYIFEGCMDGVLNNMGKLTK